MCFSKPWSIAHDSEVPSQLNIKPKSCTQQLQVSMVFLHLHLLGEGFLKNFSAISNSSTPSPLGEKLLLSSLLSLSMKASVYLAQRYFSLVLWSLILVMACMNLKCWIRQCLAQTSRTATCENSGKTWWGKDGSLGESKYSVIPWEHLLLSDFSRVRLCAIPQTAAHQAPPSLGFSRQEHWKCCHFFLQCLKVKSESQVAQSCPTLSDPMDCSLPSSSVHGIFQARVLEWGAIAFS